MQFYDDCKMHPKTNEIPLVGNAAEAGKLAEFFTAQWLSRKGYTLEAMNWRYGHKEVDLIVSQNDVLVFVEVKCKTMNHLALPELSVNAEKRTFLLACAKQYMKLFPVFKRPRFDVVSVILLSHGKQMFHFVDAFYPVKATKKQSKMSAFFIRHEECH